MLRDEIPEVEGPMLLSRIGQFPRSRQQPTVNTQAPVLKDLQLLYKYDNKLAFGLFPETCSALSPMNRAGISAGLPAKATPLRVMDCSYSGPMVLISPSGELISNIDYNDLELMELLALGAVTLPLCEESAAEDYLVCLMRSGKIIVSRASSVLDQTKRSQKVTLNEGDTIADACILSKDDDLLLIDSTGKSLRISRDKLIPRKSINVMGIDGLICAEQEEAVQCMPYCDELIGVSRQGKVFRAKIDLTKHGRGCLGRQMFLIESDDALVKTFPVSDDKGLLAISEAARVICVGEQEIASRAGRTKGQILIKGKRQIVDAAIVPLKDISQDGQESPIIALSDL